MRLKSLEYSEKVGEPEEWILTGLTLGDINLLVGKNASGKSRILNVIYHLAAAISGILVPSPSGMLVQRQIFNGKSQLLFDNNGQRLEYELEVREGKVVREVFTVDSSTYLDRKTGGEGLIWAVKEDKEVEFQTPDDQLAVVTRR